MEYSHIALWVSDIRETKAFYVDLMGLTLVREVSDGDDVENVYVRDKRGIEIQFKYDSAESTPIDSGCIDHIAFEVDDVDAVFRKAQAASNCRVKTAPTTRDTRRGGAARLLLLTDPDGYVIEFIERRQA